MADEVTVYRDAWAVPHIFARNEPDLYRATGYVMAQDRLWQMDLIRRGHVGPPGRDLRRQPGRRRFLSSRHAPPVRRSPGRMLSAADPGIVARWPRSPTESTNNLETTPGQAPASNSPSSATPGALGSRAHAQPDRRISPGWARTRRRARAFTTGPGGSWGSIPRPTRSSSRIPRSRRRSSTRTSKIPAAGAPLRSVADNEDRRTAADLGPCSLPPRATTGRVGRGGARREGRSCANDNAPRALSPRHLYQMHQVVEERARCHGAVALPAAPVIIAGHNARIAWGMTFVTRSAMDFYQGDDQSGESPRYTASTTAGAPLRRPSRGHQDRAALRLTSEGARPSRGPIGSPTKGSFGARAKRSR